MPRTRILPTLAAASAACSLLLCGPWAVSWWECPYVAYAHPAGPWTLIARCDSGIAGGTLWRSTLRDVRGIEAMMTQPVRVGGVGRRLRDAAVGFTVECARVGSAHTETSFWAMLIGTADPSALRYNFVRVNPVASKDRSDFTIGEELPLYYEIASEQAEEGYSREANGSKTVPTMSIAKIEFIGYDADGLPAYLLQWTSNTSDSGMPPHDHRDNLPQNGGLAFSMFHPGTGLPRQSFGIYGESDK